MKKTLLVLIALIALSVEPIAVIYADSTPVVIKETETFMVNGAQMSPDEFASWIEGMGIDKWQPVESNKNPQESANSKEILEHNQRKRQEWIRGDYSQNPEKYLVVDEYEEFKELSDSIVAGISNEYKKVYAIHDWICSNFYYDYERFSNPLLGISFDSHEEMMEYGHLTDYEKFMKYKRGICEDYADIFERLVRCQGIPCVTVTGPVNELVNFDFRDLHAWNEAFVDGRWIIVDTTWDTTRFYMGNKRYVDGPVSHIYFDPSEAEFARTHKVLSYTRVCRILKDPSVYGRLGEGGKIIAPVAEGEGDTIEFTVQPDEGYQLSKLSVINENRRNVAVKPLDEYNTSFQFVAPGGSAHIKAEFVPKNSESSIIIEGKQGWISENSRWKYCEGDTFLTGVHWIEAERNRYVFDDKGFLQTGDENGDILANGNLYYTNPNKDINNPASCYVVQNYTRKRETGITYYDNNGITFVGWMNAGAGKRMYQTCISMESIPNSTKDLYIYVWRVQDLPECQHPDHPGEPAYNLPAGRYFFDDEGVLVQKEGWNDGKDGKEYYTNANGMVTQERAKAA